MIKKILENGLKKSDKDKENLKNDNSKGCEDINKYIIIIISFSIISYLLLIAKIVPFLANYTEYIYFNYIYI